MHIYCMYYTVGHRKDRKCFHSRGLHIGTAFYLYAHVLRNAMQLIGKQLQGPLNWNNT